MKKNIKKFIPNFIIGIYHWCWALLGAIIFRFPSNKLIVIGITGTKGKSSTIYLLGKILESAGYQVGCISSMSIKVGGEETLNPYHMTMPGRLVIQKYLRKILNANCKYALVEVTSEGIMQHRHAFINFDMAVFTNLAPEHIEAHGSFDKYMHAKGKLFKALESSKKKNKISVINLDDLASDYFLSFKADTKIGFRFENEDSDKVSQIIRPSEYALSSFGSQFLLNGITINLCLPGLFNLYNALAAISTALSRGVPIEVCKKAIELVAEIPGRMEKIEAGQNFSVIVDLAHTPESFKQVLAETKKNTTKSLICVFGSAGGGRDKWKRPELGKIASNFCQKIILTNEDPYDEDALEIIAQIESGIGKTFSKEAVNKIADRQMAINEAIKNAQSGDTVIVLGKGTETSMVLGSKNIPWDDREVIRLAIKNR
ncbi:hypothetical protein COU49_01655 [Candidatus Nomurabacteria bacterium CG10_big_fil_rev_8_21_14_0_10_35_16]|uniref:UDP-N-acetylmuramoyl-L-alanyl-D-glutamate--2, 6-diaminopimelate ligase n=1 Tax=Candidatus Nomurabacteria bacterium CG10_big_fil_rev_8_21_14_0_10_35_16 TaxID=1974731 RepID=A0A2H0TDI0_9BACT|nr:MAG: hypothetical protein COU49_01655 [Candidatus Nomurabacteria bacterium CG10_big_fil_rev_8_21_14_0_10_35_16]